MAKMGNFDDVCAEKIHWSDGLLGKLSESDFVIISFHVRCIIGYFKNWSLYIPGSVSSSTMLCTNINWNPSYVFLHIRKIYWNIRYHRCNLFEDNLSFLSVDSGLSLNCMHFIYGHLY